MDETYLCKAFGHESAIINKLKRAELVPELCSSKALGTDTSKLFLKQFDHMYGDSMLVDVKKRHYCITLNITSRSS